MSNPIKQAEDEYSKREIDQYSFEEFVEYAKENPNAVANSVQYLVNAIEYFGKRNVVEYGKEKERYKFFDDPINDGEHAVLGNTDELNGFVNSLKRKASPDGENDKIIWFTGPTATGKSELKRCLISGLQAYAKTEEGKRYTIKWSLDSLSYSGMTYGDEFVNDKNWYKSPVHINPLSILPKETRDNFIKELNENSDINIQFNGELDPFSKVAYEQLEKEYDSFSKIVSDEHLLVESYIPKIGEGFGLLQSEDVGDAKQKIVGSWMKSSMKEYAQRGQKNPQLFTYDGLLSQGNSLISVVEDAQHHGKVFSKLMNVCEEDLVKLDNKISMHIDTLILCISNPDFEAALNEYKEAGSIDPQKALRRRLEKYEFDYLTSLVLETQLLIKHLTKKPVFWDEEDVEELVKKTSTPIEKYGTHFSPHAVEAAAYFDVLSRIGDGEIGKRNKISYYDKGYNIIDSEKVTYSEDNIMSEYDGKEGIPVTYTEEILSELAQKSDGPVMPYHVIDEMEKNFSKTPVFSEEEISQFKTDKLDVKFYIKKQLRKDVLGAMIGEKSIKKEEIHSYVDSLFAWEDDDTDNYDPYELREFERKYFNSQNSEYTEDMEPTEIVKGFRKQRIINPISKYIYENKDGYDPENIPIEKCQLIRTLLEDESWQRVNELYPNLDTSLWSDPPSNSETEEVKSKAIDNMIEMGYTEESAKLASSHIIDDIENGA